MKQVIILSTVFSFLTFFNNNEEVCASREKRSPLFWKAKFVMPPPSDPRLNPQQFCDGRCSPTIYDFEAFNARSDAAALRTAMKGYGTDESAIIRIVTKRSVRQRQEISIAYQNLYRKDLVSDLRGETSGTFRTILSALMTPVPIYYARELHDAMAGVGTDEEALVEIICSQTNYGIRNIASFYNSMYGETLEKAVRGDTSGTFQALLVGLIRGLRDESDNVDYQGAIADARTLYDAGEKRWGTDTGPFNQIMITRNYYQLRQVFIEYKKISGRDIETSISREFSRNIRRGLLAVVKVIKSKVEYFAERLYKSMKGLGTRDRVLTRIIVSRSEVDLGEIKTTYQARYGKSLRGWVKDDTSGYYRETLLEIIK